MNVELSETEVELVAKILTNYLSDLRMEIADTDNPDFRRGLRAEEESLRSILARLGAPVS
jgi:hypothetical protein